MTPEEKIAAGFTALATVGLISEELRQHTSQ